MQVCALSVLSLKEHQYADYDLYFLQSSWKDINYSIFLLSGKLCENRLKWLSMSCTALVSKWLLWRMVLKTICEGVALSFWSWSPKQTTQRHWWFIQPSLSKEFKRHHDVRMDYTFINRLLYLRIGGRAPFILFWAGVLKGRLACVWVENHTSCLSLFS